MSYGIGNTLLAETVSNPESVTLAIEETKRHIKFLNERLKSLEDLQSAVKNVTDVIEGICLTIKRNDLNQWTSGKTSATDELCRTTLIILDVKGFWLTRFGECNIAKNGWLEEWKRKDSGIKISFDTYLEAETAAKEWLVRGQLPPQCRFIKSVKAVLLEV